MQNFKEGFLSIVQYLVGLIVQRGQQSNLGKQGNIEAESFGNLGNNVYSSITNFLGLNIL